MEKTKKQITIASFFSRVGDYYKKHKVISITLAILIIASSFLRLYNLEDTLMFQGDQGRDSYIISRIFKKADLVFIGPVTSVGNMYLGPFYYYLAAPFLFFSYPSPMGPVYMVAMLSILTVFLTFYLGKQMVGGKAALIATFLMTFSKEIVKHSRFSWNPNPVPLVSLLLIFFLSKRLDKPKYWIYIFVLISIILQLHYITLLLVVAAAFWWFIDLASMLKKKKSKNKLKLFGKYTAIGILVFLLSVLPLVLFDLKHDGLNKKAFQSIIFSEGTFEHGEQTIGSFIYSLGVDIKSTGRQVLADQLFMSNKPIHNYLALMFAIYLIAVLFIKKKRRFGKQETILISITLISLIGLTNYQHAIFAHYLLFLSPVISLLIGCLCRDLLKNKIGIIPVFAILLYFMIQNLPANYLESSGWKISDMKKLSESITEHTLPNEKYNILLISESKDFYAQNYRYFLSTTSNPPVDPGDHDQADKLFVINENLPTYKVPGLPNSEIVTFPNKENFETYQIEGGPEIIIFKRD